MIGSQKFTKIVAYYRLSRPKKGKNKKETIRDAYGIEVQKKSVHDLAEKTGATIIQEFSEIESGRIKPGRESARPQLDQALAVARLHKAALVIGKQDRLGRNVAHVASLFQSGVTVICADRPDQTTLEVHIRASVDQEEAERISDRVKQAMAVAKAKGMKFGSARPGAWDGIEHRRGFKQATAASAKARRKRCLQTYRFLIDMIRDARAEGKSYAKVARELNEQGHVTMAGMPFTDVAVLRIIRMFAKKVPA